MPDTEPQSYPKRIDALELVPGHPVTEAEVYVWHGSVPHGGDASRRVEEPRPWVVLRADDWPMSSGTARRLAAALVQAADRVDAAARTPASPDGGAAP